ncbi:MAG: hypothetical protein D3926_17485 [Desulfobacteraceae bacterium]|nr:MAG: hypothetical protein D3926_17485 [Desulfobacteraceae bacterium]
MTHENRGQYAKKHNGIAIDKEVSERLKQSAKNQTITCAAVHRIAKDLGKSPGDIGNQADLHELRLVECQLGLFGYPQGKALDSGYQVPGELAQTLEEASKDNRLPCDTCWDIATRLKLKRLAVGSACEMMNYKIKPCQLGAF